MFLLNFFQEYVQELEKNLLQSVNRNGRKVHSPAILYFALLRGYYWLLFSTTETNYRKQK